MEPVTGYKNRRKSGAEKPLVSIAAVTTLGLHVFKFAFLAMPYVFHEAQLASSAAALRQRRRLPVSPLCSAPQVVDTEGFRNM